MAATDVERVFAEWSKHRPNPGYCRLTPARRKLLNARLKVYTAGELCVLMQYAATADVSEARFWRGKNDRKQEYMDLTNLLRINKVDGRIERALLWRDQGQAVALDEKAGVDLGPMGLWQQQQGDQ